MLSQSHRGITCSKQLTRPTSLSLEMDPWILNSWMSSSMELSPWHRVVSFLLAVAWWFRSVNSAHIVSAGFAVSNILLIFWVAQGPAEPPFMYESTNRTLLCLSVNLADVMLR